MSSLQDFSEPLQTDAPCDSPREFSSQFSQVDLNRDPLPTLMFSAHWEALDVMTIRPVPVLKFFDSVIFLMMNMHVFLFFPVF